MRFAALACVLAWAPGCDTAARRIELGARDASIICEEAKQHDDLPWIQANVFEPNCKGCHKGGDDVAGLSLEDGKSYTQLVGVAAKSLYGQAPSSDHPMAKGDRDWLRVDPGSPETSYLMLLIQPRTNPNPVGSPLGAVDPCSVYDDLHAINPAVGPMPENNGELICFEKRQAIERWIAAGAHADVIDAGAPLPDASPDPDAGCQ